MVEVESGADVDEGRSVGRLTVGIEEEDGVGVGVGDEVEDELEREVVEAGPVVEVGTREVVDVVPATIEDTSATMLASILSTVALCT